MLEFVFQLASFHTTPVHHILAILTPLTINSVTMNHEYNKAACKQLIPHVTLSLEP
jgi:hypothetical protein